MLGHFLSFDKLIGTKLIKFLYYLGLVVALIAGIGAILAALGTMRFGVGQGLIALVMAILGTLVGIIFWRFMCELYLLFFRMSDDLRDIKNHQLGLEANKTDVNIDL